MKYFKLHYFKFLQFLKKFLILNKTIDFKFINQFITKLLLTKLKSFHYYETIRVKSIRIFIPYYLLNY